MNAPLALKALVIYERTIRHREKCPQCKSGFGLVCEIQVAGAEEFERLRRLALMPAGEFAAKPQEEQDEIAIETGMAMVGAEYRRGPKGRRRRVRIVGWPAREGQG
jgi:hypothetical protein